ncbi:MAG: hypothetical protein B6242_00945 [Anaerolineaceae bacterium 4572_78]|nr:MAG: hypothetical protein B6242_00945 [Anaerolineaceae bacterium 4572_78]
MLTKKTYLTHVRCLECGHSMSYQPELEHCSQCDSPWLDAQYDYAQVSQTWKNGISNNITSLWRYMDLLPPIPAEFIVSMGEGNTPLIRANKLESLFGHSCIYIKDERQMPTNSFKDRQASVAISVLNQQGIQECVLASAGNAAISYSAYTAWADIKLWAFATPLVLSKKVREIAIYGAEVITVSGTYDESKKAASDFAKEQAIHCDKGAKAIAGKESMKTIAFEIAEQLAYTQDKCMLWA